MADIIQKVKDQVKVIEKFRREKSEQVGQKTQLLKQLKEASSTESIVEAEKKSEELSLELIKHEELLKKLSAEMDSIIMAATSQEN